MSNFRKNKKYTQEEKQEIIEYAKQHGITSVKKKFNVWPETVRYWMHPELRTKMKSDVKNYYYSQKNDKDFIDKRNKYRLHRKETGIARKKWLEWWSGLSKEEQDQRRQSTKQHRLDNIDHYKTKAKERYIKDKNSGLYRQKYNKDPLYKLKCNIREHLRQAIKYSNVCKEQPSIKYLGCTIDEFKQHIEAQFVEGMSWENHGRGERCWHLDHIKPLAKLKDLTNINTLREICHYTNYQPLWEKDNLSKQDKYEG